MENNGSYNIGRALGIAPLIPVVLMIFLPIVFGDNFNEIWLLVIGSNLLISYLATIIIGMPVFYVLERISQLNLWSLSLCGIVFGAVLLTLLASMTYNLDGSDLALLIFWGGCFGLLVALPFGLIAGVKARNKIKVL